MTCTLPSGLRRILRRTAWVPAAAALALAACATAEMNVPVADLPGDTGPLGTVTTGGYRAETVIGRHGYGDMLVLLAFSGGGKRSSAFSYGVLEGLRDFELTLGGRRTRLLDEVDSMASVSGGTFTAAYYALHRDRIFEDYADDFLRVDVNARIEGMFLLPWRWQWAVNPVYGTNDQMARFYDDLMFHGATYADLLALGPPFLNISATDVTNSSVFPFNQDQFDLICSDLTPYPLARAVAASNGFPVLFTPITLENHAPACGGRRPAWIDEALAEAGPLSRRRHLARLAGHYADPDVRYVHLMDGGISDNLALRAPLNTISAVGASPEAIRALGLDRVRRIVVISADGQSAQDTRWARQRTVGGVLQVIGMVSGTQIDQYNFETLQLAQRLVGEVVGAIRATRCAQAPAIDGHPCDDVEGHFVHLSLQDIPNLTVRRHLETIPTGLTIDDRSLEMLIRSGRELVAASPDLQDLREGLAEDAPGL